METFDDDELKNIDFIVKIPMINNCIGNRPIFHFKDENDGIKKHNYWLEWLKEEQKNDKNKKPS